MSLCFYLKGKKKKLVGPGLGYCLLRNRTPAFLPAGSPAVVSSASATFAKRSPHVAADATSPMDADWTWACRAWEKWTAKHVGSSGLPSPSFPSRFAPLSAIPCGLIPIVLQLQGCRSRRRCCSTTTRPDHLASSPSCKHRPQPR